MSYEKQTWVPYDDNLSEEENINAGAIVTAERMNYLEGGLQQHTEDVDNPHQVTKNQVGLGNVDNVQQAPKEDFDNHLGNKLNPHSVTASQVGAYSKAEADEKYLTKTNASEQLEGYYTKTQSDSKFLSRTDATSQYLPSNGKTLLDLVYPIGSIYESTDSTNPNTLFGGTWERFGNGRVLVGVDENDTDFTAGKRGGEKAHILTVSELAKHSHTSSAINGLYVYGGASSTTGPASGTGYRTNMFETSTTSVGGDTAHNNLQPYITVYRWRRVA